MNFEQPSESGAADEQALAPASAGNNRSRFAIVLLLVTIGAFSLVAMDAPHEWVIAITLGAVSLAAISVVRGQPEDEADFSVARLAADAGMTTLDTDMLARLQRSAEFGALLAGGLKDLGAMVRIARTDGTVIFANDRMLAQLREWEPDLRRIHPEFNADDVIGHSIGMVYKNPDAALRRIERLTAPLRLRVDQGGKPYELYLVPIMSPEGERLGTYEQWIDLSGAQRKAANAEYY